ncbi:MAG TPA: MBL fold metallo-hydrolase [Spirochaetia bacterium]|nr:MBL fold metallo-hydrolase [Spirochaetia bacterium]
MQIEWLGHACFLLTGTGGVKVLTDPFDEKVGYPLPKVEVDVVTVSHHHFDHNATHLLPGQPVVVEGTGRHTAAGIEIRGVGVFHDPDRGAKRGTNTIFVISLDGLNFCHLGDLGHTLSPEQVAEIGTVDVLCVPVGGFYTIDAKLARATVEQLKPAVVLPMHYKFSSKMDMPIAPVEDFLQYYPLAERQKALVLDRGSLPGEPRVVVFELRS